MDWLQWALFLTAATCYLAVGVAVFVVFIPADPIPRGLVVLRVVVVVGNGLELWAIAARGPLSFGLGLAGLAMYLLSMALFAWAEVATRSQRLNVAYSSVRPARLVIEGPFQLCRHPFYTSYLLSYLAGLVATGSPWLWLVVVATAVVFINAALGEEKKFAEGPFAEEYLAYRREVGMFGPMPIGQTNGWGRGADESSNEE